MQAPGQATTSPESNFSFLAERDPLFFQLGSTAERLFSFDPNASLLKLRQLGEAMARSIAVRLNIKFDDRTSQSDLLYAIHRQISLDTTVRELFHTLRTEGNRAAHEFSTTYKEAMDGLKVARQLAIWYHRAFNKAGSDFKPGPFVPPSDPTSQLRELKAQISQLQTALNEAHVAHDSDRQLLALKQKEAEQQAELAQNAEVDPHRPHMCADNRLRPPCRDMPQLMPARLDPPSRKGILFFERSSRSKCSREGLSRRNSAVLIE